ncbi:MAG: hypothetical protein H6619_03230 [Deltaproteobacteria bacterium]|nr:hypothetical protein [Deltaproteobacteria bacterium]
MNKLNLLNTFCFALLVLAMACTVTTDGSSVTVKPWTSDVPPDAQLVGSFTDVETGKKYDLWDTNGDGKPNLAESPDGSLYWIKSITPLPGQNGQQSLTLGSPIGGALNGQFKEGNHAVRFSYKPVIKEPTNPVDISFEGTIDELMQQSGLDAINPAFSITAFNVFELIGFDQGDGVNPETMTLDFMLHLDPTKGLPKMLDYPRLNYQAKWIEGPNPYMIMQIEGPPSEALSVLRDVRYEDGMGNIMVNGTQEGVFSYTIDTNLNQGFVDVNGVAFSVTLK